MRPGLHGHPHRPHIFRPADFIEQSIDNLPEALLFGCLLVWSCSSAFLFEWRTALISLVAIPLSLVAGAVVLQVRARRSTR